MVQRLHAAHSIIETLQYGVAAWRQIRQMAHRHAAAVRASRHFGPLARRDRPGGCIIISRFSWRGIPQCPPIRQVFGAGWMPNSLDADAASAAVPIIGLAVSTAAKESQQQ